MDDDAVAEGDVGLGHGGDCFLARQHADVVAVFHEPVVLAAGEVREWLAEVTVGVVEECLGEEGEVRGGGGRVVALENVVREQGPDGDGVVLEFDGLALGDLPRDVVEGLVGRGEDGDVGGCREGLGQAVDETDKLKAGC